MVRKIAILLRYEKLAIRGGKVFDAIWDLQLSTDRKLILAYLSSRIKPQNTLGFGLFNGVPFEDIKKATTIPPATLRNLLRMLHKGKYIVRSRQGNYALSEKIIYDFGIKILKEWEVIDDNE